MLNQKSIQIVDSNSFKERYVKPAYDSYCFSNIPGTVIKLFGGESYQTLPDEALPEKKDYQKVFVLFLDAFGWELFDRNKDRFPFLRRFLDQGVVSKLTSQFPSTTAVHVTSMHTGLPGWVHGIPEYRYYDPIVDDIIEPLNFSIAGEKGVGTLDKLGVNPETIYPTTTIYSKLNSLGVQTHLLAESGFINAPYNKVVTAGATNVPYKTTTEGLIQLDKAIRAADNENKQYYYLYFDQLDKMCHTHGTNSPEVDAEIDALMYVLEKYFYEQIFSKQEDALLMLIADHGQVNLNKEKAVYLNQRLPEISNYMRKNKNGKLLMPGGACRIMFIYPEPEHKEKVKELLGNSLSDIADVFTVDDLIAEKILLDVDGNDFYKQRLPSIFIQPHEDAAIWWYEEGKFEINKIGNHGGLAMPEMEIPFLALNS